MRSSPSDGGGGFGKPVMAVLLIFIVLAFIPYAVSEQILPPEFTLTIDSRDVVVRLPDGLPSLEAAEFGYEECFNLVACRQRYCLNEGVPSHELHDHVDFIYTDEADVLALVWVRTLERMYVAWRYVDGVPVPVDIDAINDLIGDIEKPKGTSLDPWPSGGGRSCGYPLADDFLGAFKEGYEGVADFTWEGELDPDDFDDWKVIKATEFDARGILWVFWRNPDTDSPIKVVVGEIYFDETLIMYRYFKRGEPHMFYLDKQKNRYVRYSFTDEERKNCMSCHQDEVEPPAILDEVRLDGDRFQITRNEKRGGMRHAA